MGLYIPYFITVKEGEKLDGNINYKTILHTFSYWPKLLILYYKTNKIYFIGIIILTLLQGVSPVISLYLTQLFVNTIVTTKDSSIEGVLIVFLFFVGFVVVRDILGLIREYIEGLFQTLLSNHMNMLVLTKASTLEQEDFENVEVQDQLKRAQQETSFRPYQIFQQILAFITSITTLISSVIFLFQWNWWMSLLLLLTPFISIPSYMKLSNSEFVLHWQRAPRNRMSWYYTHLLTHDKAFKEVKLFGVADYLLHKFEGIVEGFYKEDKNLAKKRLQLTLVFRTLNLILMGFAIFMVAKATMLKQLLVGSFISYIQAITLTQSNSQHLAQSLVGLCQHNLYIEQLFHFLNMQAAQPQPNSHEGKGIELIKIESIEFKNVSFTYPGTDRYALKGINLFLKRGDAIAIVGKNGSGKSTLIKLIAQLYKDYEGEILINDINIHDYTTESIRSNIGVVFQDFMQYEMPVRENIGISDYQNMDNDDKIYESAFKSGISDLVKALPAQINTQLGKWFPDGIQLSGGQWQRIAIARAFFKDGSIFVLDEPSAALDPESEKEVFEKFTKLIDDKIGIFITHRYTSTRFADRIIYMEDGELNAIGTHQELMHVCNEYRYLYNLQIESFQEPAAVNT
ncbi:ATP-binding cassette, subfamily B [Paenibacillus algorifonticola]|uniref:ATP-binding cassette, subfamily B n=1 Tax=Paenibacillus algorifonticola TaxID=684063 RepID=A0A1I2D8X9_9BACL|nr:ABC transporter ATP-binding protein [Paenibacillus algorifonticola]SFE76964.1 ATP-binding cassette, subfamily B [Paenibacillus algorifonticola]